MDLQLRMPCQAHREIRRFSNARLNAGQKSQRICVAANDSRFPFQSTTLLALPRPAACAGDANITSATGRSSHATVSARSRTISPMIE